MASNNYNFAPRSLLIFPDRSLTVPSIQPKLSAFNYSSHPAEKKQLFPFDPSKPICGAAAPDRALVFSLAESSRRWGGTSWGAGLCWWHWWDRAWPRISRGPRTTQAPSTTALFQLVPPNSSCFGGWNVLELLLCFPCPSREMAGTEAEVAAEWGSGVLYNSFFRWEFKGNMGLSWMLFMPFSFACF